MVAVLERPEKGPGSIRLCKRAPPERPHWKAWGAQCPTCQRGRDIAGTFAESAIHTAGFISSHQLKMHAERTADMLRGAGRGVFGPLWLDAPARVNGDVAPWTERDNPRRARSRWRSRGSLRRGRADFAAVSALMARVHIPTRERQVYEEFFVRCSSYAATARALGVCPSTVRTLLRRLRGRAR